MIVLPILYLVLVVAFAVLAHFVGAKRFFRDLAISVVGVVPLAVALFILDAVVQLMRAPAAGSGGMMTAFGLEVVLLALGTLVFIEMLILRMLRLRTYLWVLAAVTAFDLIVVAWGLAHYRPG